MTSKAIPSLQHNRDPSCENQLRIFTHSACDLKFSYISPFSSGDLHSDLLHLLSPTPFSFLCRVTCIFGPHIFLQEKSTWAPFFVSNHRSGLLVIVSPQLAFCRHPHLPPPSGNTERDIPSSSGALCRIKPALH